MCRGQRTSFQMWTDRRRETFYGQCVGLGCRESYLGTVCSCFTTSNFEAFLSLRMYGLFKIRLLFKVRLLPLLKIITVILYHVIERI